MGTGIGITTVNSFFNDKFISKITIRLRTPFFLPHCLFISHTITMKLFWFVEICFKLFLTINSCQSWLWLFALKITPYTISVKIKTIFNLTLSRYYDLYWLFCRFLYLRYYTTFDKWYFWYYFLWFSLCALNRYSRLMTCNLNGLFLCRFICTSSWSLIIHIVVLLWF